MSTRTSELRARAPPIQTSMQQRPQTAPHSGTPTLDNFSFHKVASRSPPTPQKPTSRPSVPTDTDSPSQSKDVTPAQPGHQRFVLNDPVAFRYLEEDPATQVLERRQVLHGYECYVVEQWATSRSHPTFMITTHTGDASSSIIVGVLSVPTDESTWSPRLRVYFKALNQYHARRRETPLGIVMVTNLSGFPSSLTVIAVPDGDLRSHRSDFFVNENLKRLNCSGRVGLTLIPPSAATTAKFHQVYRTSDKNGIYSAVIELVKLCQSALMLFDKLEVDYADGLLCDITERAVNDWWVEIGSEYFTLEPHDGILGPTTVAGLLGLLMGARNRLHSVNAPVSKDPFDVEAMKKGISAFQKQQRLPRTRRLDRRTLERLHRNTQKAANSEGYFSVPKAVKSTVAELSGKGGDLVMDVVHRKDRAGIAEIETCDLERFVQLVFGERARWLWYGKAVKHKSVKENVGAPVRIGEEGEGTQGKMLNFREAGDGGFTWTARKSVAYGLGNAAKGGKEERDDDDIGAAEASEPEDEGVKGIIKRATGFEEAKKGLGKVKGAVGLGGQKKQSRDSPKEPPQTPPGRKVSRRSQDSDNSPWASSPRNSPRQSFEQPPTSPQPSRPSLQRATTSPESSKQSARSPVQSNGYSWNVAQSIAEHEAAPAYAASYKEPPTKRSLELPSPPPSYMTNGRRDRSAERDEVAVESDNDSGSATIEPSFAGSVYEDGGDIDTTNLNDQQTDSDPKALLQRTKSFSNYITNHLETHSDDRWPRHLSFSLAEDTILTWAPLAPQDPELYFETPFDQLQHEKSYAQESVKLSQILHSLSSQTATFTTTHLSILTDLLASLDNDQRSLDSTHEPLAARVAALHTESETLLREEGVQFGEGVKELETLVSRLEYEIGGLKGRVKEVGTGVGDFERGVGRVEERVAELEREEVRAAQKGWGGGCVVC